MYTTCSLRTKLLATAAAGATAVAFAILGLRTGPAAAQPTLAVPACQCSAPSAIPSMSTSVVYCVCGGMSCVISDHRAGAPNAQMQCVR